MKRMIFIIAIFCSSIKVDAQSIGIGTPSPNGKALLDISSINKGVLLPRMTTSQRLAISSPPNGLMLYDTDKNQFYHYDGTDWQGVLNSEFWSRGITNRARIGNLSDSVGIGTFSPTAKLDIRGDLRIVDGNEAEGRVLTSDVNGRTSWRNAALTTNDRILVRFTGFSFIDSLISGATVVYDNGPGLSYISSNTKFIILKSGLYHFEGTVAGDASFGVDNYFSIRPFVSIDGDRLALASHISTPVATGSVTVVHPFSFDMYFEIGTQLQFKFKSSNGVLTGTTGDGYISAYLISE